MIKLILNISGLVSALLGTLIGLPDKNESLRPLQIGVNELSWFPALLGQVAALGGLMTRPRAWSAIITGGVGVALSNRPFLQYPAAAEDMRRAMRAGLGGDYEPAIPAVMRMRLPDTTWSLVNALGRRERQSAARLISDVEFSRPDSHSLKVNIYQPLLPPAVGDDYPAIIVIHGGGWRHGDRGGWFEPHNHHYASLGYVVFDIQYRLSGVAKWPAQLDDVQTAIRWVKAHAADYAVDPERVALLGRSAGAHLALMAGYCPGDRMGVAGVVSIYAPTELRWPNLEPGSAIFGLFGGPFEEMPDAYESAVPINFVRDGLPPTLIVEGGMDTITPYFHGDSLMNALSLTDTPFVLLRVPWARHGFDAVLSGLGTQLVQYHLDRFLAWSLYRDQTL